MSMKVIVYRASLAKIAKNNGSQPVGHGPLVSHSLNLSRPRLPSSQFRVVVPKVAKHKDFKENFFAFNFD